MKDEIGLWFAWLNLAAGHVVGPFFVVTLCVGLAACAEDRNYPSLSKITDLGSILTPQERQKAVEDLQKQDQAHTSNPSRPGDQQ